ncbi:MAG: hypothetical protein ACOH18_05480 [Candidatus Saccharimonadaceae bacterium]
MSAIGTLNLELTEQAEALGFETLEHAFEAGFEAQGDKLVPSSTLAKEVADGQRLASLLGYSDSELKNELERRVRDHDRRAPME